jgi:transposase
VAQAQWRAKRPGSVRQSDEAVEKLRILSRVLLLVVTIICSKQAFRRNAGNDGSTDTQESLFYYFRLEDQIPEDHLLRLIDQHIDLSFVRERLKNFYSGTGRSLDRSRSAVAFAVAGITLRDYERTAFAGRSKDASAYRWFTRLDFEQETPDHSTFSKNRHGRFRQSGVFREVFEEIVRRCLEVGLVEGKNLAVDGTMVGANASRQSRVRREQSQEAAQVDPAFLLLPKLRVAFLGRPCSSLRSDDRRPFYAGAGLSPPLARPG